MGKYLKEREKNISFSHLYCFLPLAFSYVNQAYIPLLDPSASLHDVTLPLSDVQ